MIDVCLRKTKSRKTMRSFWLKARVSKASQLSFTVHDAFSLTIGIVYYVYKRLLGLNTLGDLLPDAVVPASGTRG